MNCYQCGKRGTPIGLWFSKPRRHMWSRFRCVNPACRFTYTRTDTGDHLDGTTGTAGPTWMTPTSEVRA